MESHHQPRKGLKAPPHRLFQQLGQLGEQGLLHHMAAQHHEHINPDHGQKDRAAQPLYQCYPSQHPLIEGQGAHAAPGKCHRHEVGRHEQPHEFQYLFQHLSRHLETGCKTGCQAGKQQKVCDEKTCIGYLSALKNRRNIGKHGSDDPDCSHLEQHMAAFINLGK